MRSIAPSKPLSMLVKWNETNSTACPMVERIRLLSVVLEHEIALPEGAAGPHLHRVDPAGVDLHHSQFINILCSTHVHLDRDNCLETIIIKGRPQEIERIAVKSSGLRGVRFAKLTRASAVEA